MCHWYLNKLNHFSIIYKYANCVCVFLCEQEVPEHAGTCLQIVLDISH